MSSLGTIVIGAIAAYIAYQQWRVNHAKFKLDLFTKRYDVYKAAAELVGLIAEPGSPLTLASIGEFRQKTGEAEFFFGPEIVSFLNEVARYAYAAMGPKGADPVEKTKAVSWATHIFESGLLQAKFRPYLDLREWR